MDQLMAAPMTAEQMAERLKFARDILKPENRHCYYMESHEVARALLQLSADLIAALERATKAEAALRLVQRRAELIADLAVEAMAGPRSADEQCNLEGRQDVANELAKLASLPTPSEG